MNILSVCTAFRYANCWDNLLECVGLLRRKFLWTKKKFHRPREETEKEKKSVWAASEASAVAWARREKITHNIGMTTTTTTMYKKEKFFMWRKVWICALSCLLCCFAAVVFFLFIVQFAIKLNMKRDMMAKGEQNQKQNFSFGTSTSISTDAVCRWSFSRFTLRIFILTQHTKLTWSWEWRTCGSRSATSYECKKYTESVRGDKLKWELNTSLGWNHRLVSVHSGHINKIPVECCWNLIKKEDSLFDEWRHSNEFVSFSRISRESVKKKVYHPLMRSKWKFAGAQKKKLCSKTHLI